MDIQNKVIIMTGASEGIGLAATRLLVANGAKVVLASRSAEKLSPIVDELTQQGVDVLAIPIDARKQADVAHLVQKTLDHYGRIDVLINNAGQSIASSVADLNIDDYREVLDLNIFGVLYAMQAVIPHMRRNGGGIIMNISSMTSKMVLPFYSGYASSKAALNMLSLTARAELEPDNIRVITVYPRYTLTDFRKNARGDTNLLAYRRPSAGNPSIGADTAEDVAAKMLQALRDEPAEQYMTDDSQ